MDFKYFVQQVCELAGCHLGDVWTEIHPRFRSAVFFVDECQIALFQAHEDVDAVMLRGDFGQPSAALRAQALESAMQFNCVTHARGSPVFGLDPATDHVVFHAELFLDALDPATFSSYMVNVATMRRRWLAGVLHDTPVGD